MVENQIKVFENTDFGSVRVVDKNGEPWFVGKDVAEILGYVETAKAIRTHVEPEDKGVSEMDTPGGKQNLTIINESGLYSLIIGSKLPEAKKFKRWVTSEVLPSIRKTGKYSAHKERDEVKEMNAKVRMANALHKLAKSETVSDSYKRIIIAQAVELLTGVQMPLEKSEKTYSAGDIGKMFGVSAQKIGRLSNEHNLKTDEFGAWYHDKSRYSDKEVDSFRYNERAVETFRELLGDKKS